MKLSERLRVSAVDQIEEFRKSNFVTKLLTFGELNEYTLALAYYEEKEAQQTIDKFVESHNNGIKMATNDAEKTFFENQIQALKVGLTQCYENEFKPAFGTIPDEYWAIPQYPNNKEYLDFLIKVSKEGSIVRLLAVLYCGYIFLTELYDYPKTLKGFKENLFHDILSYHKAGTHKGLEMICDLIDAKEPLNAEEEKAVFDTFKTGMILECELWSHLGRHWGNKNKFR